MLSGLHSFAPCVAAAGGNIGDLAGPIIVFIVIAIQLMRAARVFAKNKPNVQRPSPRSQSSPSPEDELRDFLGSLSGEPKPAPVSAPTQSVFTSPESQAAPPPIPMGTFIITRHTPAKTAPIVALPVPDAPAPIPIPVKTIVPQQASRPAGSGRRLADIVGRLGSRHLLREAIILREVLGPPLGQRPRPPIA
jgi:hypothetical protein